MIIVPEIETVFILVPRTSTGSLYRTVRQTYPRSMLLYRHMEADGVPAGYDRWRRVGFVRHPMMRLWSLYGYMSRWKEKYAEKFPAEAIRIDKQASVPFEDWLLNNEQPWTTPADLIDGTDYWPIMMKRDPSPENKRSQFSYLRPDLGTVIHKFEDISDVYKQYGMELELHENARPNREVPAFSNTAWDHVEKFCAWDLAQGCKYV